MTFPKRRRPPKSGIARAPRREYPAHRKHIRGFECGVGDSDCEGGIECAHVRFGTDGGLSQKPSDIFTHPLCWGHHHYQHLVGELKFQSEYQTKFPKGLRATALEYARRSPSYFKDEEFRAGVDKAMNMEGKTG